MYLQVPSPSDLELSYARAEGRLRTWLRAQATANKILYPLAVGLLFLIASWALELIESLDFNFYQVQYVVLGSGIRAALFLSALSLFCIWSNVTRSYWYLIFALIGVAFSAMWPVIGGPRGLAAFSMYLGLLTYSVVLSYVYLKWRIRQDRSRMSVRVGASVYTLLFLLAHGSWIGSLLNRGDQELFFALWGTKMIFLWLGTLTLSLSEKPAKILPESILNPVHGFRGVLWPEQSRRLNSEDPEFSLLWWRGLLNLGLAIGVGILALLLHRSVNQPYFLVLNYFEFFLVDIACFNLVTGTARVFGYPVRDATHFVLLAKTPNDTWRRGSVYHYSFILRFIFFPLLVIVRNRLLVTLLAFSFFALTHWGGFFLALLLEPTGTSTPIENKLASARLLQIFLQAILISTAVYWWPISAKKISESKWAQWGSIVLTHLAHFLIVYLAFRYWFEL
jgi:hypothetical protein